jgi:hypothetical protein
MVGRTALSYGEIQAYEKGWAILFRHTFQSSAEDSIDIVYSRERTRNPG